MKEDVNNMQDIKKHTLSFDKDADVVRQEIEDGHVPKQIYFGHNKPDQNTEYELNCIEEIKKRYPGAKIINTKDIKVDPEYEKPGDYVVFLKLMQKYYFPEIDKSDVLIVVKSKTGKYGPDVSKEIAYAKYINKPIEYLDIPYPNPNRRTAACDCCGAQTIDEFEEYVQIAHDNYACYCPRCRDAKLE